MRLLLDENLPKKLKQDLREHDVFTVLDTYTNAHPILKSIVPQLLNILQSNLSPGATVIKLQ